MAERTKYFQSGGLALGRLHISLRIFLSQRDVFTLSVEPEGRKGEGSESSNIQMALESDIFMLHKISMNK